MKSDSMIYDTKYFIENIKKKDPNISIICMHETDQAVFTSSKGSITPVICNGKTIEDAFDSLFDAVFKNRNNENVLVFRILLRRTRIENGKDEAFQIWCVHEWKDVKK